jgi:transcriptional regulator with XRE-family HTH domain
VTRKFAPFDEAVIRKEFLRLPNESARDLKWAMENFAGTDLEGSKGANGAIQGEQLVADEKDFLEIIGDDLEAVDPSYALDRQKERAVSELMDLRTSLGLSQRQVAERMGLPSQRVTEIESRPWRATWERIHAYARALGAEFTLTLPSSFEEKLVAAAVQPEIDVKALGKKLKELAEILAPLANAR